MSTTGQARLPAAERRQAIVDAALPVFATGSYSGATTAGIARAAGISEPILYRHFASKRELYLACLEAAWVSFRAALDTKLDELGDREAVTAIGQASREFHASGGIKPVTLWIQALNEAGGDEEIQAFLRRQLREVHDYIAAAVRRGQAAGGVPADRDADAEAWIFVGAALLLSFADRLGGLLGPDDFGRMAAERRRWLTGRTLRDERQRGPSCRSREAKPTLQGSWREPGSAPADPGSACAQVLKDETSPAAAPGTFLEASCHSATLRES